MKNGGWGESGEIGISYGKIGFVWYKGGEVLVFFKICGWQLLQFLEGLEKDQSNTAMSAEKGKPKKKEAAAEGKSEVYQKEVKRKLVKAAKKGGMKEAPPELLIAMKEERLEDVARMIKETEALKRSYANVEEKQTLFHAAIRTSSLPLVLSLISLGVSTCDVDLQFRNALHHLASTKNPSQALIDAVVAIPGLNLSEQDASGATPLHSAIIEDNPLLSQTLINTPGTITSTHPTPLSQAHNL